MKCWGRKTHFTLFGLDCHVEAGKALEYSF